MPRPISGDRYARARTDAAISRVFRQYREQGQTETSSVFGDLLVHVRARSRILQGGPISGRGQPHVDALRNLAGYSSRFVRPASTWPGSAGSIYDGIASLSQHLLGAYPVPRFLCSVWYGDESGSLRSHREWFVGHAAGERFRDQSLPMRMSRRMERHFLASRDHLSIPYALRRAELLALGADPGLANAVCGTRLGWDLSRSEFWRTVSQFFVRVADQLCASDIGSIVDYIHAVRHEVPQPIARPAPIDTQGIGGVHLPLPGPPQPEFSMRGRSVASVLRLVEQWHRVLEQGTGPIVRWHRSPHAPIALRPPSSTLSRPGASPVLWEIVELTNSHQLQLEGRELQHCVASYTPYCRRGESRIWTLRRRTAESTRSEVTLEVDPRRNAIVQAKGLRNRSATGRQRSMILAWAAREGLTMEI